MTQTSTAAHPRTATYRGWDVVRVVVALGWIASAVALPLISDRTSSWNDLEDLVASGEVADVQLSPELPNGSTGFTTVHVHWSRGGWDYVTQITQVRGTASGRQGYERPHDSTATVRRSPSAELRSLQPGVRLTEQARDPGTTQVLGFAVPNWLSLVASLLGLTGVVILIAGPQPWRATKWAWFWLISNPVTATAFALLSGPTPFVPAPRNPQRRLTGGWAFLIMFILTGSLTIKLGLG